MSSKRIPVIYGGTWSEREISIESARTIVGWLQEAGLNPIPVRWDEEGWVLCPPDDLDRIGEVMRPTELLQEQVEAGIEAVFNVLHGGAGENGTLAALLGIFRLAHTGAGVSGSAVSACKITFRQRLRGIGMEVAVGAVVHEEVWQRRKDDVLAGVAKEVGYPCLVKDPMGGSSIGLKLVHDPYELQEFVESLFQETRLVLVEQRIVGREISVACLGASKGSLPQPLQPIEIKLGENHEIFDYEAKYKPGHAEEVHAELSPEQWKNIAQEIRQMHLELDLGTASRTDLILTKDDGPVYLETNTVPGCTERSILPVAAELSGINGPELVKKMLEIAVGNHLEKWGRGSSAP
ncbi:MAG: hypothetical protein OSB09_01545 [Planctomycetota bacterium]|nr:hypothetical protein [Planctomycetota bacterium]